MSSVSVSDVSVSEPRVGCMDGGVSSVSMPSGVVEGGAAVVEVVVASSTDGLVGLGLVGLGVDWPPDDRDDEASLAGRLQGVYSSSTSSRAIVPCVAEPLNADVKMSCRPQIT